MKPDSTRRYRDRLAPVVDHVRANLRSDLRVEALARVAHFSPYHFHRVFTAVMGETVATFVRRARLERAVQLMRAAPDRTLGRIALAAGFGSASDFSRSFRRHYGMPPSRWDRRSPLTFRVGEEEDPSGEGSGGPGERPAELDLPALVAADDGGPVETRMERYPARHLARIRVRRPWEAGRLDEGYRRLRSWLDGAGIPRADGELWGMSWEDVEVAPAEQIRYDLACPVPEGTEAGEGIRVVPFPAVRVVAAHAVGGLARVARVWDHLYHAWLPRSGCEPDNLPALERYRSWPAELEAGGWDLDCCIPVVGLRSVPRRAGPR